MPNLRILAFIAVAAVSTGCLRITHTFTVKPDGSGTITQTIALTEGGMQQVGAMVDVQGGRTILPSEEKLRSEAAAWGQGVRFVSVLPYKTGGLEGITTQYAFDDVTKLTFNMENAVTGAIDSPMMSAEEKADSKADLKLAFTREGGQPVLVITMPEIPKSDEVSVESKKHAEEATKQIGSNPGVEAMMKQMMEGLLVEVAFNIEGQIVQTNAPFVEGSRVVLMRLDGNELVKHPMALAQFLEMGESPDFEAMAKKIPGLKMVTQREVKIVFK